MASAQREERDVGRRIGAARHDAAPDAARDEDRQAVHLVPSHVDCHTAESPPRMKASIRLVPPAAAGSDEASPVPTWSQGVTVVSFCAISFHSSGAPPS